MTTDDFKSLKIGDRVMITNCGMDSGTKCVVADIRYDRFGYPALTLEPIERDKVFVCGNGALTRRKLIRSCGTIKRIDI